MHLCELLKCALLTIRRPSLRRWDNYDDDFEEAVARTSKGKTGGLSSQSFAGAKVHPGRVLSGVPVQDVLHEKGSARVLLW